MEKNNNPRKKKAQKSFIATKNQQGNSRATPHFQEMNIKEFVKGLIDLFAENTNCGTQFKGCPCNSCFHSQEADFKHICWLIVLALRGDYPKSIILDDIKANLK